MAAGEVRATLVLAAELLAATDRMVREEKARSRNEVVAAALRRERVARS